MRVFSNGIGINKYTQRAGLVHHPPLVIKSAEMIAAMSVSTLDAILHVGILYVYQMFTTLESLGREVVVSISSMNI